MGSEEDTDAFVVSVGIGVPGAPPLGTIEPEDCVIDWPLVVTGVVGVDGTVGMLVGVAIFG